MSWSFYFYSFSGRSRSVWLNTKLIRCSYNMRMMFCLVYGKQPLKQNEPPPLWISEKPPQNCAPKLFDWIAFIKSIIVEFFQYEPRLELFKCEKKFEEKIAWSPTTSFKALKTPPNLKYHQQRTTYVWHCPEGDKFLMKRWSG